LYNSGVLQESKKARHHAGLFDKQFSGGFIYNSA